MTLALVPVDPYSGPHRSMGPAFALSRHRPAPQAGAPIEVLVAHPQAAALDTLHRSLSQDDRVTVIIRSTTSADAKAAITRLRPAVVVVDERLSGWQLMARHARIVLLTGETDARMIGAMLRDPASAYLTYEQFEPADLLAAVHAVADGLAWLSPLAASAATAAMREWVGPAVPPGPPATLPPDCDSPGASWRC